MKLYSIPYCPFANRVHLGMKVRGLTERDLPIDTIDLAHPPESLLSINPFGSVPTLELSPGNGFNESLVILQYLDSLKANGPRLYGESPVEVAKTQMRIEHFGAKFLSPIQGVLYARGLVPHLRARMPALEGAFAYLESESVRLKASPFFGGETLGALDCALAPFFVRLPALKELVPEVILPRPESRAGAYLKALLSSAPVQAVLGDAAGLRGALENFAFPAENVRAVAAATRALVNESELLARVRALNEALPVNTARRATVKDPLGVWHATSGAKGHALKAEFHFENPQDAIDALTQIHLVEDTADHHTATDLRNLKDLTVTLVTHEPKWGVTEKDLALARALTQKIFS